MSNVHCTLGVTNIKFSNASRFVCSLLCVLRVGFYIVFPLSFGEIFRLIKVITKTKNLVRPSGPTTAMQLQVDDSMQMCMHVDLSLFIVLPDSLTLITESSFRHFRFEPFEKQLCIPAKCKRCKFDAGHFEIILQLSSKR